MSNPSSSVKWPQSSGWSFCHSRGLYCMKKKRGWGVGGWCSFSPWDKGGSLFHFLIILGRDKKKKKDCQYSVKEVAWKCDLHQPKKLKVAYCCICCVKYVCGFDGSCPEKWTRINFIMLHLTTIIKWGFNEAIAMCVKKSDLWLQCTSNGLKMRCAHNNVWQCPLWKKIHCKRKGGSQNMIQDKKTCVA